MLFTVWTGSPDLRSHCGTSSVRTGPRWPWSVSSVGTPDHAPPGSRRARKSSIVRYHVKSHKCIYWNWLSPIENNVFDICSINLCKELLVFQDFQISNIADKSTLTITEVFPEDEGHYSCKAVNIEGEITSTCQLLVEGRLHPLYKQRNLLKSKPNLLQGFHSISYVRNKF